MSQHASSSQTSFRDRPINIDDTGKRKWIFAKKPMGKWYNRRTAVAWVLLSFLVIAPFLKVNGHPFMLLDIANRKFYLFGATLLAQDTYLLAIVMLITVVAIVLFTVIFGRIWCGWACPQTLFLEMIFRRIEYLFDGNYRKGVKKRPPSFKSFLIRITKHATFLLVSVIISNVFLMWFIRPEGVYTLITSPISEHLSGFLIMMGISLFYYWIYTYFREQVCTMVCPYGRMQGVLLDSRSISVIYDFKRGEPRGAKEKGDCINCGQCISVCPTGIDIKNGSQLECINCTACIDECNTVMRKINKPQNLIRFDSYQGVESGKTSIFNTRSLAYTGVLLLLFTFLVYTVSKRTELDASILRMPGTLFQEVNSTTTSNIFNAKIINKTDADKLIDIRLLSPKGEVEIAGQVAMVESYGEFESILIVRIENRLLTGENTEIEIGLFSENILLETVTLNFIGPSKE